MSKTITRIKLKGLPNYLLARAKLRFGRTSGSLENQVNIFGQNITLDIHDLEQKYLFADCVREPENLYVYRAIAETGLVDTFIDIGANCGHVALSVLPSYSKLLLFEPNPKLANILRTIFKNNNKVIIKECAIVDDSSIGNITLTVPVDSSGLATLGGTDLSKQHIQVNTYEVKAASLAKETESYLLENAYIKIDVEGFEANIIQSAKNLIHAQRPIVGFEALSKESALDCATLFTDYVFYCARFDFLESGGALMNSFTGMLKGLIMGANIEVIGLEDLAMTQLKNFSQIYSVPIEKAEDFEKAIKDYSQKNPILDLSKLTTWLT